MALCTDRFFIDISFRNQRSDPRHYTIVAAFTRITVCKTHIGVENDKAVAQIERIVDRGASGTGHMVVVQCIGIAFIEIHDYRIFSVWIEIRRFIDDTFQWPSVQRYPGGEFGCSPDDRILLADTIRQPDGLFETEVGQLDIRILFICFLRVDYGICVFGFRQSGQFEVAGQQCFGGSRFVQTCGIISETFGDFVETVEILGSIQVVRSFFPV